MAGRFTPICRSQIWWNTPSGVGKAILAANGALNVHTGSRSGRSPGDKYLEDTPSIHGNIDWGKVNQPCTPEQFSKLESIVREYLGSCDDLYRFDGFAGALMNATAAG